jgi:hypothetical protein
VSDITHATCWSVRQCIERAAALDAAADGVVAQLDRLEYPADGFLRAAPPRWAEHQAAVDHIAALLQLTQHLIVNLMSGYALPPPPGATPRRPEAVPATHPRRVAQPPAYTPRPPKPAPPPPPAATPRAPKPDRRKDSTRNGRQAALAAAARDGLISTPDMVRALGISKGGFYAAREAGRIPAPHTWRCGMAFWRPEQLAACTTRGAPNRNAA